MNHLLLLSLEIILNLLALPVLFLSHVLVVTLRTKIVCCSHAQSVSNHRGDSDGEDEGWGC